MDKSIKINDYSGMTVNERFFSAGLLDEWDMAARNSDRMSMIRMLQVVGINEYEATKTVEHILDRQARNPPNDSASKP